MLGPGQQHRVGQRDLLVDEPLGPTSHTQAGRPAPASTVVTHPVEGHHPTKGGVRHEGLLQGGHVGDGGRLDDDSSWSVATFTQVAQHPHQVVAHRAARAPRRALHHLLVGCDHHLGAREGRGAEAGGNDGDLLTPAGCQLDQATDRRRLPGANAPVTGVTGILALGITSYSRLSDENSSYIGSRVRHATTPVSRPMGGRRVGNRTRYYFDL